MKSKFRSTKGSGLAEIAVAALILVTIAIFAMDIGGAMVCYGVNDRACRDAARAAAQASTEGDAQQMAKQILQSYAMNTPLISPPTLKSLVYQDFGGNPPAGKSPTVTVTTSANAHPVAPISLVGKEIVGKDFIVQKTYTFPIVKLNVPTTP